MGLYTITLKSRHADKPNSKGWKNSYDVRTEGDDNVEDPALVGFVDDLVAFQANFAFKSTVIYGATISTYVKNDQGKGKEVSKSITCYVIGVQNTVIDTQVMPDNLALAIGFNGNSGRNGTKYYRGALISSVVDNIDGQWVIDGAHLNGPVIGSLQQLETKQVWQHLVLTHDFDDNTTVSRGMASLAYIGIKDRKTTAVKKPLVTRDETALIGRVKKVRKEIALIQASINFMATLIQFEKPAEVTAEFATLKALVDGFVLPPLPPAQPDPI